MYLISACLAGFKTRYDGCCASMPRHLKGKIRKLVLSGKALPVCPELLGGLPIPRPPVEFHSGDGRGLLEGKAEVRSKYGINYSGMLLKGGEEALNIARLYGIKEVILKDGSPSCGISYVYRKGRKVKGVGVTTAVFLKAGLKVKTIDSL